jgi:hypothetical protein
LSNLQAQLHKEASLKVVNYLDLALISLWDWWYMIYPGVCHTPLQSSIAPIARVRTVAFRNEYSPASIALYP